MMIPVKPKDAIWTDEQWQAIHDCDHNIIVSAGAGSGKTAVLSERVITNLKKGMHINEMLLLTFTKAAASEMKERIRKKIKKDKSLSGELDLIDEAYITTFDSFALSVVKKYHYLLNVSPSISIIDSSMIEIKKCEILDELFEKYYNEKNEKFLKLIGDFCIKDDKEIKSAINRINSKLDMLPNKKEYLDSYLDVYFNVEKINKDINDYVDLIKSKLSEIRDEMDEISYYVDSEYLNKLNDALSSFIESDTYDEILMNLNFKLPMLPKGSGEDAKAIKDNISVLIKKIKELCCYENLEDIKETILLTRDYVEIIIEIIKELDKLIFNYKFGYDVYEFNDIALFAIKVLRENPEVREEMKYFFKEIMIDEYQDTNDLQETFIGMIENDNVYMVGDIKQSIYRFRNANPDIFKNKYDNYSLGNGGAKIDLNKNFRSRKEVLDNINLVFNMIMDNDIGGADYVESHQMVFGNNSYIEKGSTLQNNDFEIYQYEYEVGSEYSKEEIECFMIARDIKEKLDTKYQVFDKDEGILRDISYKDFVILMDRTTNFDLYKRIFEYFGIPLAMLKDEKMNEDQDILVLNNLVQFVVKVSENKFDTEFKYLFMSILRSFLFEYSDDKIFDYFINNNYKECDLYKKTFEITEHISSLSSYELLLEIISKFNYYECLIKIGNIDSSMVKVDKILSSASNLANIGYDVYDFANYLKTIIEQDYEMKYSVNMGDSDSVKIMTIHKSKGLEYHICYFSGLYKSFNILDLKERFTYDKEYGIIVPYFKEGIGQTIYKELLSNRYILEEISEKIRLFYVALTRAKEKMILLMNYNNNVFCGSNAGVLSKNIRSKYRSLADVMNSVIGATRDYYVDKSVSELNMSKDYSLVRKSNYRDNIPISGKDIVVNEVIVNSNFIKEQSFSKYINKIIDRKSKENIELGLYIHEILENIDLKNPDYSVIEDDFIKGRVQGFVGQDLLKNVDKAKIYHEYEFIYDSDNVEYHGIIDLMLEYDDYVDIIDYKLKDIGDEHYLEQLQGYKNYIEKVTLKKVNIYLYSIIDNCIKKLS